MHDQAVRSHIDAIYRAESRRNGTQVHDLAHPLAPCDELVTVQALSGG